ncbi:MAG: gliding motility protein U [Deltaproteobacteria bacterium]|nr:MAG: gliding motility protein U [Deltaproteobacteria bacterium]
MKSFRPALLIALALLVAGPAGAPLLRPVFGPEVAYAQRKKKRKKKRKKRQAKRAKEKETTKEARAGSAVPEKAKKEERTGPASISEMQRSGDRDLDREALADKKRDEAIAQLKKIIPKIKDPSQKADLLFQLAELWWEKSKFVYFREMAEWDKAYDKWMEETARGVEKPEPVANHRESELYRAEAIKLYESILKNYPRYPRNDEVLFNLAYNMYETDRKKEGVALYWELIKKYPKSRFVPDAYLQMGEHFFNSNQVFKAQKAYQNAFEKGDARVKPFALYKLAWCDYNLGEYGEAQRKLQEVVAFTERQARAAGKDPSKVQLKSEALRDMILTFMQLDQVEPAIAYYRQHDPKRATKWIAKLADAFFNEGKNEEAITIYRQLINDDPYAENAPEYQAKIVRAYANLQERKQVLAEMQRLVELYGPDGPWANANKDNKEALRRAYELAESTQRELVTEYHQEAQKTQYASTYRLAAEIYKRYLEKFSDSEYAYNLRFYYAEILYTLEEYEEAAKQYLKVVESDPAGKYTLTAAYNALLAYEKLAAIDRGEYKRKHLSGKQKIDEKKAKGSVQRKQILKVAKKSDEAEEIPKWEQKQIEASDAYVRVIDQWRKKHAKRLSKKKLKELEADEIVVRYKAAFLLYDHRHYAEAAKRFEDIILKWPKDKWAEKAANLILNSLEVKEQWAQLNDLARKFRKNKALVQSKAFASELDRLIEGSAFKMVMDVYNKGELAKAAVQFRAFVKEFPKSKYAATALYNAMIIFDKAKELDKAIAVGEQLLKNYKDSDLVPLVIQALGSAYERIADYEKAARYYELFAQRYLDKKGKDYKALSKERKEQVDKTLADNLFNAALWYEGIGKYGKAIDLYLKYIENFEKREDVPDILYNVATIYERQKKWDKAAETYDSLVKRFSRRMKPWQVVRARYKQAKAYEKLGKEKEAKGIYENLVKLYAKLPEKGKQEPIVKDAVANAAFVLLEPEFEEYRNIKLDTVKQKELQKRLSKKTQQLADLEKKYTDVIAYGSGDWAIAALTRIGLGYQDFARSLLDAPIPPGLDADQEELYRSILEEKAFPLEEKAIEALEKALEKSYELGIYNDWTLKAQEVMLAFRPNAFGEIHEVPFRGSEFFITGDKAVALGETPKLVAPKPKTPPEKEAGSKAASEPSKAESDEKAAGSAETTQAEPPSSEEAATSRRAS